MRACLDVPRRIVLITPAERHELAALKDGGFTGYLVKPVRAASLAARLTAADAFEPAPEDAAAAQPTRKTPRRLATRRKYCRFWWPRTTRSARCSPARC